MLTIQSVDEVIIRTQFKLVNLEQGFQYAIHVQHLVLMKNVHTDLDI